MPIAPKSELSRKRKNYTHLHYNQLKEKGGNNLHQLGKMGGGCREQNFLLGGGEQKEGSILTPLIGGEKVIGKGGEKRGGLKRSFHTTNGGEGKMKRGPNLPFT